MSRFCCVAILFLSCQNSAIGQLSFQPFQKKIEADPAKSYQLTPDDGPWLILATSFAGEKAYSRAKQLAIELRRDFRLKSYVHRRTVDLSQPVEGLLWNEKKDEETGQLDRKKMKHLNGGKFEEVCVVIGDFHSVEDPGVPKTLERVKSLQPKSYNLKDLRATSQFIGAMRQLVNMNDSRKKNLGPFRAAFLFPNPTLPDEFFNEEGTDHFIINLNKTARYSLLENRKLYSVRVATFRGDVSFNLKEIEDKKKEFNLKRMFGGGLDSKLAEAAEKASQLTAALRKRDVEAYEFHDRHESYVCVGSFDWVGTPRVDGRQEINPAVLKVIEMYKAYDADIPGLAGLLQPRSLPELPKTPFDLQPLAVKVPQISVVNRIMRGKTTPSNY